MHTHNKIVIILSHARLQIRVILRDIFSIDELFAKNVHISVIIPITKIGGKRQAEPFFEKRGYRTVCENTAVCLGVLLTNYITEKSPPA